MEEKKREPAVPTSRDATGKGVYLYCFARSGMQPEFPGIDLEGTGPVTWVEVGEVAAVCSSVALDDFAGESGELHLQDPSWVVPRACRHERVIETVMESSPVFPVRFGAVFSSRKALANTVADHAGEISSFLDGVMGKEEWAVKCCVDVAKAAERLLESDPALAERLAGLPTQPGARYFREKTLRADALKQAKRLCRSAAEEIERDLAKLSAHSRAMSLPSEETSGEGLTTVLKRAFLLDRRRVAEFRRQVDEIGTGFAERGISLDLSGPWPPYSFCKPLGKPSP